MRTEDKKVERTNITYSACNEEGTHHAVCGLDRFREDLESVHDTDCVIRLSTAIPGKKMRPISVQWAGLSRADGSARFAFGRFILHFI